jgi:hypothetical protein
MPAGTELGPKRHACRAILCMNVYDWELPMARLKKPKKEKKPETTAEFITRVGKQDIKRSGLRIRLGFANHGRR